MDVGEKRDFPPTFKTERNHFLGSESNNQNSAKNIFQHFLTLHAHVRNFWMKPFPGQCKLIITLHYIIHTKILLS